VEVVTGIGGFFFRARDPKGLAIWYQERLGIKPVARDIRGRSLATGGGRVSLRAISQDSKMIGTPEYTWMINFRVVDLETMVIQLRDAGETVEVDPERYPNGRFAELRDPEGNGIQLWQPMEPD
jgi:catechol-2,3-dioxygenase